MRKTTKCLQTSRKERISNGNDKCSSISIPHFQFRSMYHIICFLSVSLGLLLPLIQVDALSVWSKSEMNMQNKIFLSFKPKFSKSKLKHSIKFTPRRNCQNQQCKSSESSLLFINKRLSSKIQKKDNKYNSRDTNEVEIIEEKKVIDSKNLEGHTKSTTKQLQFSYNKDGKSSSLSFSKILAIRGGETHSSSMNYRFGKKSSKDYQDSAEENEHEEEDIYEDEEEDDDEEEDEEGERGENEDHYNTNNLGRNSETVINLQGDNIANTQNNISIDDIEEGYDDGEQGETSERDFENDNDFGEEDPVDEEDFNDDAMWPKIKKEWRRTPPLSKGYISISIALTSLSFLTSKNEWPEILQLDYSKALLGGQVWRLITPFFHHGPLGLNYFLTLQFVWTYMAHLERMGCHNPAMFPTALLFGATLLLIGSHIFQFAPQWLGHNLSCFLVYIWSRLYEGADVDVMGLFHLPAHLLPWFLVAQTLLLDHIMPWPDLLGIAVGHFYHDLTIRKMLKPPSFLKEIFNHGPLKKTYAKIKDETM